MDEMIYVTSKNGPFAAAILKYQKVLKKFIAAK